MGGGTADLCCEVRLRPYRDWRFEAVRLGQPDTVLVLGQRSFQRRGRRWVQTLQKELHFAMNKGLAGAELELGDRQLAELQLSGGKPHRQLEPGMFFWRADEPRPVLRGNVRLNEPDESSMDKLGWFRLQQGAWTVRRGPEKISKAQVGAEHNWLFKSDEPFLFSRGIEVAGEPK